MISKRDFLQAGVAAAAIFGAGGLPTIASSQSLSEDELLAFTDFGNVSLLHVCDIHAQLKPIYFREPSINIGVGDEIGAPPYVTGADFLKHYGIEPKTPHAYALSSEGFWSLAREYGRMGGLDRVARVVETHRAARPDALLLDSGDTWQGSYTSLQTRGADMVRAMAQLRPDAMTAHWEFTYGADRVAEIVDELGFAFLGANIFDVEWDEPAFESTAYFDRGGAKIAVIGQAFPYLPIANPRWMFPNLSFGIREERLQEVIDEARADGATLVVLLSHNGFGVDRKLAGRVKGLDVILCGHTHDALPEPVIVDGTLLVASGSHGKFVSRLDLDVKSAGEGGGVRDYRYKLTPIFSDAITPDPEMSRIIEEIRAPYETQLAEVVGRTETGLYRRGNFNGTFDDLICEALLSEREADIALSPGFRWGASLPPGADITREDVYNATAMTYPEAYRSTMSGEQLATVLEDIADNLFNEDPYYRQGGDMVRVGGLGYRIDVSKPMGARISEMTLLKTGEPIDPSRDYVVAGWASIQEDVEGPPIWEVLEAHLRRVGVVDLPENQSVKVVL